MNTRYFIYRAKRGKMIIEWLREIHHGLAIALSVDNKIDCVKLTKKTLPVSCKNNDNTKIA